MYQPSFTARVGAVLCLVGMGAVWVSLFLPYQRITGAAQNSASFVTSTSSWINSQFSLPTTSPVLKGLVILAGISLILAPFISMRALWGTWSPWLGALAALLVLLALGVSGYFAVTVLLEGGFLAKGVSAPKSLEIGFFLLPLGLLIATIGAGWQIRRGKQVAVMPSPAAPRPQPAPKYSYFQEKAMHQQNQLNGYERKDGRLR
jgi:hypothetical protein